MFAEKFYRWMSDDFSDATLEELEVAISQYPYFQPFRFLYLRHLYLNKHVQFYQELEKSIAYVSDRRKLFYYLALEEGLWNDVFDYYARLKKIEPAAPQSDTFSLIDSFLSDHAPEMLTPKPLPTHKAALMAMATHDYAALLVSDEYTALDNDLQHAVQLKNHELIDEFISFAGDGDAMRRKILEVEADDVPPPVSLDAEPDILSEEDLLTESLAKIYIKQKRYYKAIEIIRRLSLKYPEKSIYFADQIRFLEKLVTNIKKE